MKNFKRRYSFCALLATLLVIIAADVASAAAPTFAHSAAARIQLYLMASPQQEVALARSAAPPSISAHAAVMVLGAQGYVTAIKGSNGFVCLVERSWANAVNVKSTEFWNTRFHAPFCFNTAGAQSVLPRYLMRTQWVLAGASEGEVGNREETAWAAGKIEEPAAGAMCYMMSKRGRLNHGGPWRPHLMFFFPRAQAPNWGANLQGTPVFAQTNEDTTMFFVLVPVWSDGTPAPRYK